MMPRLSPGFFYAHKKILIPVRGTFRFYDFLKFMPARLPCLPLSVGQDHPWSFRDRRKTPLEAPQRGAEGARGVEVVCTAHTFRMSWWQPQRGAEGARGVEAPLLAVSRSLCCPAIRKMRWSFRDRPRIPAGQRWRSFRKGDEDPGFRA